MRARAIGPLVAAMIALLPGCTSSGTDHAGDAPRASAPRPARTGAAQTDAGAPAAGTDWPTYHRTFQRSGVAPSFPTPRRLRLVANLHLDGAVYGSPIVSGGRTFVATENASIYAFDRAGHQFWRRSLGSPARSDELPCGNISPLGITGTPVIRAGVLYAAA